jgi:hypothetical protein
MNDVSDGISLPQFHNHHRRGTTTALVVALASIALTRISLVPDNHARIRDNAPRRIIVPGGKCRHGKDFQQVALRSARVFSRGFPVITRG